MADYLEWGELTPERLKRKVMTLLEKPEPYLDAMSKFELTGLSVMSQRIEAFRNREP